MKRAGSRMQQNARFTEFDYMEIIGHGDFGLVVRVREKATGTAYAMKIIDKMRALNKVRLGEMIKTDGNSMHFCMELCVSV